MKTTLEDLQDSFEIGYKAYEESRLEADLVMDLFHNRQYTPEQLSVLSVRGQPAETFNVIKMFGRLILGYYSTVVNSVKVSPVQLNDIVTAGLLNDVVDNVMQDSHMETEGDKIKLDGLLQGLLVAFKEVLDTKDKDQFGRIIRKVRISHVPAEEVVLDPMSRLEDYSDARFIHRWKWVPEEEMLNLFPSKKASIVKELATYHNHVNVATAEFENTYGDRFVGKYKLWDNYLLIHTVVKDDDGKVWSIYWSGDLELDRKEVTYRDDVFPYRVCKVHTSNKTEYYGIFREIIESQKAINQALLKIQLMANTQKIFVEDGGVDDIGKFTNQVNRVNAIIPVKKLMKIKVENLSKEVLDQYTIIDKALSRIQRVLGVNDSFLGMAYASDSGRKVKLQQNATTLALRYVSTRIEQFYRLLGWDIVNLVKQYYTANQVLRIVNESVGEKWVELNKPMQQWTGRMDANGQPIFELVYEEVLDPASNEPMKDDNGRIILAPVAEAGTEIAFTSVDVTLDSVVYNDEDEKNQLMLETILQGNIGATLSNVNPVGYFKAASLSVKSMKTRYSPDISGILDQTAQMLATGQAQMPAPEGTPTADQQTGSMSLKLPQNTNEGV